MSDTILRVSWVLACVACAVLAFGGTPAAGESTATISRQARPPGEGIVEHRDIDYLPDTDYPNDWDKLDILLPKGVDGVPIVFFVHGGSLMQDDKTDGEYLAPLLRQGIGVVTTNYRLSPAVMHPAHVEDIAAAFAWVVEHIESYGGDAGRLYLAGHSAGGYLVALMALDPSYLGVHGLDFSAFRGVVPISPFLYVEETAPNRDTSVGGTDVAVWRQASVSSYIGPDKPPMLLLEADGDADWRRNQIQRLARELRAAGNRNVEAVTVANRRHMTLLYEMANDDDPCLQLVADFVRTR